METAAQALFVYLCSGVPGASLLPVGAAVSSLVDTEAAVAGKAGLADDFSEGSRTIELAEYSEELDPEPSMADRAALAQGGFVGRARLTTRTRPAGERPPHKPPSGALPRQHRLPSPATRGFGQAY